MTNGPTTQAVEAGIDNLDNLFLGHELEISKHRRFARNA
jgi:hypothetical protein